MSQLLEHVVSKGFGRVSGTKVASDDDRIVHKPMGDRDQSLQITGYERHASSSPVESPSDGSADASRRTRDECGVAD